MYFLTSSSCFYIQIYIWLLQEEPLLIYANPFFMYHRSLRTGSSGPYFETAARQAFSKLLSCCVRYVITYLRPPRSLHFSHSLHFLVQHEIFKQHSAGVRLFHIYHQIAAPKSYKDDSNKLLYYYY
jgi:hypothetical protein